MGAITVNREELNIALDFIKNIVPARPIIAADGNITVEYDGKELILVATDGIQGARAKVVVQDSPEAAPFSLGVDPKRLIKVVAKDTSANMTLEKIDPYLHVGSDGADDFATLAMANMRRASVMMAWTPRDPTTDIRLNSAFLVETLTFLDDFLPDGKDEGAKHAVVVLSNRVAHATNGINLRGICASGHLAFTSDVSMRKKYLTSAVRAMKFFMSDFVRFRNNVRVISVESEDGMRTIVMPSTRKKPPVVPLEYLKPTVNSLTLDVKEAAKGIDRISSSNYNTATTLTGVDLTLRGEGEDGSLRMVLDDDKASQTFPCVRTDNGGTIEKTLDVKTFFKMMKMFQKSKTTQIEVGDQDSRVLRFFDTREVEDVKGAFIAVCSYARKV